MLQDRGNTQNMEAKTDRGGAHGGKDVARAWVGQTRLTHQGRRTGGVVESMTSLSETPGTYTVREWPNSRTPVSETPCTFCNGTWLM